MRKLFRNQQLILFLIQRSFFGNGLCVSKDQKSPTTTPVIVLDTAANAPCANTFFAGSA